ncbi:PepSY domain-containing protein, partial [Rubrivivax gelatinosus]|uniref:PepSY domain-containing protein n=1 Tax=Rubrivivax gelatinosus TaxID=28068 RepID=UPI0018733C46
RGVVGRAGRHRHRAGRRAPRDARRPAGLGRGARAGLRRLHGACAAAGGPELPRFGASNLVNNWLHPLHDASAGGLWLRVPVALAGLLPALLLATGVWRWALLRRARREAFSRRAA